MQTIDLDSERERLENRIVRLEGQNRRLRNVLQRLVKATEWLNKAEWVVAMNEAKRLVKEVV
jgi:chaperonin cofactor prefoldin